MSKTPVTPPPDDDETNPLTPRDQQTIDDTLAGLAFPEENLFGDPAFMDDTGKLQPLDVEDFPTVCIRCGFAVEFCICPVR